MSKGFPKPLSWNGLCQRKKLPRRCVFCVSHKLVMSPTKGLKDFTGVSQIFRWLSTPRPWLNSSFSKPVLFTFKELALPHEVLLVIFATSVANFKEMNSVYFRCKVGTVSYSIAVIFFINIMNITGLKCSIKKKSIFILEYWLLKGKDDRLANVFFSNFHYLCLHRI